MLYKFRIYNVYMQCVNCGCHTPKEAVKCTGIHP